MTNSTHQTPIPPAEALRLLADSLSYFSRPTPPLRPERPDPSGTVDYFEAA